MDPQIRWNLWVLLHLSILVGLFIIVFLVLGIRGS
jgi:hypothetical protein